MLIAYFACTAVWCAAVAAYRFRGTLPDAILVGLAAGNGLASILLAVGGAQ